MMIPDRAKKTLRPFQVGIFLIVFAVVGFYSTLSAVPTTVVTPTNFDQAKPFWISVFPQGWAFFSKSQRDPLITPYIINNEGQPKSKSMLPSTQIQYAWGISRNARGQGVEVGNYAASIPNSSWKICSLPQPQECVKNLYLEERNAHLPVVNNPAKNPSICGPSFVVEFEPVSWSYRTLTDQKIKALRAAYIDVSCRK